MNKFYELFNTTEDMVTRASKQVERLEEQIVLARKTMEHDSRDLTRLKKIQEMARYTGDHSAFQWQCSESVGSEYMKVAWREYYRYTTTMLEFGISLIERTNLKKFKWEVSISGTHTTLCTKSYKNDGYSDRDYLKEKYMTGVFDSTRMCRVYSPDPLKGNINLTQKFSSEDEARAFISMWQLKLYNDHEGEIEYEKELILACKELMERA